MLTNSNSELNAPEQNFLARNSHEVQSKFKFHKTMCDSKNYFIVQTIYKRTHPIRFFVDFH